MNKKVILHMNISFVIMCVFLSFFSIKSFAADKDGVEYIVQDEELNGLEITDEMVIINNAGDILRNPLGNISPASMRYATCPGGNKHQMVTRCRGDVIQNGVTRVKNGYATQCIKCGDVLVSQNSPYFHTSLGYYAICNYNYPIGNYVYMTSANVYYNSNLKTDSFFRDSFVFQ